MKTRLPLFTLALSALGLFGLPDAASAFTFSYVNSTGSSADDDTAFNALNPNLAFVAEGRIGSNTIGGNTYELDIHGTNPLNPTQTSDQDEFVWSNGGAAAFSLSYDAMTKAISYTVGDKTLTSVANSNPVTDIFVRTRAAAANSSMLVQNLFLNGIGIPDSSFAQKPGDGKEYLWLAGLNPLESFTLTGESVMNWTGSTPGQSNLAYQIKVGNVAVPEPSTLLGLALTGGAVALGKRRRKQIA
ncbi:MAG: PEP-CTERM sorting domain-containing protein [Oscillatoria princeps RMCB-10]|jgi:hypothetical protein|nr:PEP-CTERM sorting domain-containing protein [Oscillatoria princeps RMCB-10]